MLNLKINILLIDDDEDDFIMFRELLSQINGQSFEVDWAHSFEVGKEKLIQNHHDICFLDFRLGPKTGLDLLAEAMSEGCKLPIILLTGYGEREVDLKAMSIGAADYLVKDQINPYLLEKTIRYAIHRNQSLRAILDREAQILMQDRLASVGLLASSLAHEIGTPLGVIRGRAEYLDLQVANEPQVKKNVEVIISQIDRVSKLIKSLLNLARGDQIKQTVKVNVNEVASEVLDLIRHEFNRREIQIQNLLPDDGSVCVKAESGPLHQVFLNLFVNAMHAVDTAKENGRKDHHLLRISAKDAGAQWEISVEDSGCGISEANLKNLFKPFFTTKDIGAGTGLGLVTIYRIVEAWSGTIQVKSVVGQGATFLVFLPKA